jgi:hypothetical protein
MSYRVDVNEGTVTNPVMRQGGLFFASREEAEIFVGHLSGQPVMKNVRYVVAPDERAANASFDNNGELCIKHKPL